MVITARCFASSFKVTGAVGSRLQLDLLLDPQRSPKTGSSAHLVKGEDERVRGGTSSVSRAMRKYCGIRVSWVAEVIFRFAYEPVAVAVPLGSPGGAADC